MHHGWPGKNAIVDLPISMKGNSKDISSYLLNPFWGQEQASWRCFADISNLG